MWKTLEVNYLGILKSFHSYEINGGSLMAIQDKFTDNIIVSTLNALKAEHGWNEQLVNKIMGLHNLNNLTNLQSLSNVFEEASASKETEEND